MSKLNKAFTAMVEMIKAGTDFATAHETTVCKFKLSDKQSVELIAMYDEQ